MKIRGTTWLVTGASGGIGSAIAKALSDRGACLVLVGRDAHKLEALKAQLPQSDSHRVLAVDLLAADGIDLLMQHLDGQPIDGLVNNAGCNQFGWFAKRTHNSLSDEITLNLLRPIELCHRLLSEKIQPCWIVNIGSTFGAIGYPGYASYCAAKAGLQRFSEALDRELSAKGIRVLHLAPRATQTQLNPSVVEELNQKLGNHSDSPELVAEQFIDLLLHEQRSRFIGWPEKLFARLNQLLPGVVGSAIRRQYPLIAAALDKTNVEHPQ
ncbi:SDR family oxidoreductase [Celerinatantimonas sp. MCCC 1A17872]|uniref:SDR family oxidoreductase n=1 Tax=Celerinatantimonas sp. MCCC 1A17872 TaxID=3177514 RepID=UPI0038C068B9